MVHISELALSRVQHPQDILHLGQQVEVAVLRVEQTGDPKRPEKIALSIRALAKNPWSDAVDRYRSGARVSGKVTRTQPFGAFVEIEPGLEGLIHISELGAGRRINHPEEVLRSGERVEVTVLQVDPERRRISLSLDPNSAPADAAAVQAQAQVAADNSPSSGTFGDLLKAQLESGSNKGRRG
jgi:small subunit ribosomal protein S1